MAVRARKVAARPAAKRKSVKRKAVVAATRTAKPAARAGKKSARATKPAARTAAPNDVPKAVHSRLRSVAEFALLQLGKLGVDSAELSVAVGHELEVSVRKSEVELVKEAGSSGLSVRIIRDGRVATSSTTDFTRESISMFLRRAVEMAEVSEKDPLAAPPPAKELAKRWPTLELFDPRTDRIGADEAIALARRAEAAALGSDPRITASEGASFSRTSGHSVLATTGGFMGERSGTYQSVAVQAIADDAGGKKRSGVWWTGGRFFAELESPEDVGVEAARRAIRQLGAMKFDTGVVPVVFEKDAARAIIGLVASCVLGDSVYRERSYLGEKLEERVASELVTLVDDPLLPRGPGSRAFDGEGRAVAPILVCDQGVLKSFLLDTYSARKLGKKPTGSAGGGGGIPHASTSNFFMRAGTTPPADLLKGIERGLFVTRMMGFGFDPTTGNFSRGAEGMLIENGELTVPIGESTISRNLDELLQGIDAVGDDLDHRTATSAPSFRVDHMTVAGQ
jgi:PmbA protein